MQKQQHQQQPPLPPCTLPAPIWKQAVSHSMRQPDHPHLFARFWSLFLHPIPLSATHSPFQQVTQLGISGPLITPLQAASRSLLTTVAIDAEAAAAAAAPLAALHTARTNMEAGCATLREAAELSGAFRRVEEVFAAGDLPRVADMLRSMARRWVFTYFS